MPIDQVQAQFRRWFMQWGLPQQVRLDNGWPWGGRYDLPTAFALWLLGLGLTIHFNPARTPQDNGVIERANGLGQRWAEVKQCASAAELQERLDAADVIQREHMPSVGGRSRMEAYDGVRHSGRPYSREWEEEGWSLTRVEEVLETYVAKRKVAAQGRISLYYRQLYVGQHQRGSEVQVQYDRGTKAWVISSEQGKVLRSVPAIEVCREKIMALTMYEEAKQKRRGEVNEQDEAGRPNVERPL